ncbi:S41 family peptidase [Anaerobranca gottschalkii]|uniref:Carboxyl-terminal processing protease n=1 Tax=Anaerobranca gottschalkii DSM 13577 TaxID=1120990 RepID=A0A1H9ZFZ4_9FIRM|nr:S41 family peptidase [Anaerobranca gottschalkii]SES80527.1 carboxyl-terminal processing protease [Anaerobranca gottschalkii DSM 13577]
MKKTRILTALVVLLFITNFFFFVVGYNIGSKSLADDFGNNSSPQFVEKLNRIIHIINDYYFNDYQWEKIENHVYREIISALGDPYSEYLTPRDIEDMQIRSGRSYGGIGVEVTMNNGRVTVVTPMDGSPGQKAGLLPGDIIVEVDGKSVEGLSLSETVDLIRGEPDTEVVLGIIREGLPDIIRVSIIRGIITTTAVKYELLQEGLGYIKLTRFAEGADEDFAKALRSLREQGMENLIIDLRGNPGGYLNVVVNIAQLLVPEGEVVYMEDKHGNRVRTYTSNLKERDFEVVVLIDEFSASASEILAGALKDREAGTLIGQKTFGKGSVQTLIDLRDGSAVKLTVQKYFTPSGAVIDGVGVSPHIEVEQPPEARFSNFVYKGRLEVGSSGLDVVILHKILYYLGYGEDRDDPNFTEKTKEGVIKFQRANGLPATGIVDRQTGEKINAVFAELQRERDLQLQKAIEFFK